MADSVASTTKSSLANARADTELSDDDECEIESPEEEWLQKNCFCGAVWSKVKLWQQIVEERSLLHILPKNA